MESLSYIMVDMDKLRMHYIDSKKCLLDGDDKETKKLNHH